MSVKVVISGDGLNFERETSLMQAGQIIAFLSSEVPMNNNSAPSQTAQPFALGAERQRTSPREILISSGAKTNSEKIVALGKYIVDRDSQEVFSSREVREILKKLGESMPANFSRDLKEAIKLNYIFEGDSSDTYFLTETGEEAVMNGFRNMIRHSVSKKKKSPSKSSGKKAGSPSRVREEVNLLEPVPNFSSLKPYWNLESKGQRILWILSYATQNNLPDLAPKEIEIIASKLRDNIPGGSVPALTKNSIKKAEAMINSTGNYKLLKGGEDAVAIEL